ncbi:MAG: endopeptidase La [Pseudomonadales bacterium]|nr:endopeptidase La [Pseudomonadales bacterium]
MNESENAATEFIPKEEGDRPQGDLVRPEHILPDTLHLIPLTSRPYFPVMVQPVIVDEKPWATSIEAVVDSAHRAAALNYSKAADGGIPRPNEIRPVGCVARIHKVHHADGKFQFIAQGMHRFEIIQWITREVPYVVRVEYLKTPVTDDEDQLRAYAQAVINIIKQLMTLNPLYNEELKQHLNRFNPNDASPLADFAAAITSADAEELQDILETIPLIQRMEKVLPILGKELEVAKLQAQITEQMQEQVDGQQREFFLRQQLKVIQKELGIAKDDRQSDVETFEARMKKLVVPEHVTKKVAEELQKLGVLEASSAEYGVTRNYLEWVTSVPWGVTSDDKLDIKHARKVLDQDHDGLDDVKQRIIEFLAVGSYRGEISGSILLLVGPPGTGKTSIGHSVADALGRKFYRFSLGGMRDEAEIKGHRRTYIGAMPGKFVQALKEVEVSNPVIMLDEVDKIGASYQGDPASALLEVLDPEQNSEFLDHYLDLRLDLSKVLFMCTANTLDSIPSPLLDRMEVIRLSGYLTAEKVLIARHHLWRRQLDRAGVPNQKLKLTDAAIRQVIEGYAREAGVRNLEKQLGSIIRKAVVKLLEGKVKSIKIGVQSVEKYLGPALFHKQKPRRGVGVINGLAWTALGGTTLAVEASRIHSGNRGFKLTGQLGDVMRESAEIAYSYVVANLGSFGSDATFFDNALIHLHVPEGATPKDGPSAGITMATALLSLATNRKLARDIAMTGELTLTGKVLPIGGVREKVIAARRAKVMELVLPAENRRDFDEMPDYLKEDMVVHFAARYQDVADAVF